MKDEKTNDPNWFALVGWFLERLGMCAFGFAAVVLASAYLCKWLIIPVLRAKGWTV